MFCLRKLRNARISNHVKLALIVGVFSNVNNTAFSASQSRGGTVTAVMYDEQAQTLTLSVQSGGTTDTNTTPSAQGLVRLHLDGTLDTTFGRGGKVTIPATTWSRDLNQFKRTSAALRPDGKILIEGTVFDGLYHTKHYTGLFDHNGRLDTTYGTNGYTVDGYENLGCQNLESRDSNFLKETYVDRDGRLTSVMMCERNMAQTLSDVLLIRRNPNGEIDRGFGENGYARAPAPGTFGTIQELEGVSRSVDGTYFDINVSHRLIRFGAEQGTFYYGFANGGFFGVPYPAQIAPRSFLTMNQVIELPDRSTLLRMFEYINNGPEYRHVLKKVTFLGDIDTTYGNGGSLAFASYILGIDYPYGFHGAGTAQTGPAIGKTNIETGNPDTTFGGNGIASLQCILSTQSTFLMVGRAGEYLVVASNNPMTLTPELESSWINVELMHAGTGRPLRSFGRNGCTTIRPEDFLPFQ